MATATMLERPKRKAKRTAKPAGAEPWYARNKWISTRAAAEQQERVVAFIEDEGCPNPSTKPDETALFAAMHTCAYKYAHSQSGSREREGWLDRWKIVRDHIVEANLGLAYSMVGRFNSSQVDCDDLSSEAMYGLYRAVERYNPWKGYRFSTYACNCIARACMRQRKREQRRRDLTPVSFDSPWNLTTDEPDHEIELRVERLKVALESNAAQLNPLEKRILDERFPARQEEARTFKQIARLVGLSKERVRQIQNIALGKLKEALNQDRLLQ